MCRNIDEMNSNLTWIFLLIVQLAYVSPRPLAVTEVNTAGHDTGQALPSYSSGSSPPKLNKEKVISVRITSSVAIGRGKEKATPMTGGNSESAAELSPSTTSTTEAIQDHDINNKQPPSNLEGANIEFLKQLNAKKDLKHSYPEIHPYEPMRQQRTNESDYNDEQNENTTKSDGEYRKDDETKHSAPLSDNIPSSSQDMNYYRGVQELETDFIHEALKYSKERLISNATDDLLTKAETHKVIDITSPSTVVDETYFSRGVTDNDDSLAEPSTKEEIEIPDKYNEDYENIENVPLARSVLQTPSSKNFIQGLINKPLSERETSPRLTTVSFNIVHDTPKPKANSFSDPNKHTETNRDVGRQNNFYDPPKVYSEPAKFYSEPAKFYSEPAKIYSEPAKIYSEPAKVYSEPAKIYSEPAKFYSEPASLHLTPNDGRNYSPWQQHSRALSSTSIFNTTPLNTITIPGTSITPRISEHQPEKNYEVDEKVSVLTDGRSHGVQESTTEKCRQDSCKVGYVVKGRQYNKYRVEERTSDGFIVGEYGVVRNEDGALRGVRYTADGEASPRLIYDALMKFLQLK